MGRTMNGGGDQLARGARKVTFRQPDVSEKKYNEATQDFDMEKFMKGEPAKASGPKERVRKSR